MSMTSDATLETLYTRLMRAGTGQPYSANDACSADGETLYFIGSVCGGSVFDAPQANVYSATRSGAITPIYLGRAKLLELAPSGTQLAFAASGVDGGNDRLVIVAADGTIVSEMRSDGRIEQIAWSPDGSAALVLVAGAGTDTTTLAGSVSTGTDRNVDAWVPVIDDGAPDPEDRRWLSIHRPGRPEADKTLAVAGMIWEASWCGKAAIVALLSEQSGEAAWYKAGLVRVDLESGDVRKLYQPQDQIGQVRGAPDGDRVAFVEGVASDRGLVCGALKTVDAASGSVEMLSTGATEITSVAWRGTTLHLAGQRGLLTAIGDHDMGPDGYRERWSSEQWSCGAYVPTSRPAAADSAIIIMEGQTAPPRLAIVGSGGIETICIFADAEDAGKTTSESVRWRAPDGLEIEGILVRPAGTRKPLPTVVDIHGGPIWAYRARWEGRQRATPALVAAGFAVLYPNPRGSFGRGQDFARRVHGDMGGADVGDILSGIDHLIAEGLADPDRIGLTGSSYGGYMSALLPKIRPEIAAAVSISPVSNWFSQHFTSNMPILEELFIGGVPGDSGQNYLARSPALSPAKTRAATLILAGALDRCTPIGQSIELHRSLLEQGSLSVLMTYPQDGHSIRSPRGYINSAARTLDWFLRHMAP